MYFNEALNQANSRNEFHTVGTQKVVEKRQSSFPWRIYKEHYVWKQTIPGGFGLVKHAHPTMTIKVAYHYECDWAWIGNEYPFFH